MAVRISNEQLKLLKPYIEENFFSELIEHCKQIYPYLEQTLGKQNLKQAVKIASTKANQLGFMQRPFIQAYLDILIMFGIGVETDPQYAWLQSNLQEHYHLSEEKRAKILNERVQFYLANILAEGERSLADTTTQFLALSIDKITVSRSNYIEDTLALLYDFCPQKYQQIQQTDLMHLVTQGTIKAQKEYQLEEPNHAAFIVLLMFLFGHQFDQDPFYSWSTPENLQHHLGNHELFITSLLKNVKSWVEKATHVYIEKTTSTQ